jgi:hypothetical protein
MPDPVESGPWDDFQPGPWEDFAPTAVDAGPPASPLPLPVQALAIPPAPPDTPEGRELAANLGASRGPLFARPGVLARSPSDASEALQAVVGQLIHPIKSTEAAIEQFTGAPKFEGKYAPPVKHVSEILELGPKIPKITQREGKIAQAAAGAANALLAFGDFFLTPGGAATLGIGSLPQVAQKAVLTEFAAGMAEHQPELLQDGVKLLQEGKIQEGVEKLTSAGGATVLSPLLAKHVVSEPVATPGGIVDFRRRSPGVPQPEPAQINPIRPERIEKPEIAVPETLPESERGISVTEEILGQVGMGGAKPAEFAPSRETATGIKNAMVDKERQARGQEPILAPQRLANTVVWDRVMAKIDTDPGWQDRLVADLKEKPRTPSQDEIVALDHRYVDLQNEYAKATRDGAQHYADGYEIGVAEAKARADFYEGKLNELEQIARKVGTEWGRSGQMRQRLIREDFSLAAMEAKERAAKGFVPLTEQEHAEIAALHEKLTAQERAATEAEQAASERISILEVQKALAEAKAISAQGPAYEPSVLQAAEKFAKFMDKKGEEAVGRIRERLGRTSAGIDPTILSDVGILGAAKITRGAVDFAKWTNAMVRDLGEWFREYATEAWEESQKVFGKNLDDFHKGVDKATKEKVRVVTTDFPGRIEDTKTAIKERAASAAGSPLHSDVKKLVRLLVEADPKITRDALIDTVHEILKESLPEITRLEAMDAISGRGKFSPRKKAPQEIPLDTPAAKAKAEVAALKEEFHKRLERHRYDMKSRLQKIWHGIKQTRGAIVNIVSSFDFSAPRQALTAILANTTRLVTNPVRGTKMLVNPFVKMFQAWSNESRAGAIEQKIKNRPNAKNGADDIAGIEYSDINSRSFTKHEENAHSIIDEWAKLPLRTGNVGKSIITAPVKLASRGVRMSNRAFVTFLNATRAELFDELLRVNFKDRAPTEAELKVIGNMVNVATGRGKLDPTTARITAEVLWAPKLLTSRVQILTGQPLWGGGPLAGSARARKIVAKEYFRIIIGGLLLSQVSRLFDEKDETPITSSDWAKIVRGDTRIDPWAGLQQVIVAGARGITGETTTLKGKTQDIGAERKYGVSGFFHVLANFFRSKTRPDVGAVIDILDRRNYIGEPTTPGSVAESVLVPLPMREITEIMKEHGFTEAMILQILNQFGAGVSHYEEREKQK